MLNPHAHTVGWQGSDYEWDYSFITGNWSWTTTVASVAHTWVYNGTAQTFTDQESGEVWMYDAVYDVWVNSPTGTYTITTPTAYPHQVWRLDQETGRWHPVVRNFVNDTYSFDTVESMYWEKDGMSNAWNYVRSVDGTPVVPTAQSWVFEYSTLTWQQQNRNTPVLWRYNSDFDTGQWKNEQTGSWWRFLDTTDQQSRWDIVGYVPGYPWDVKRWSLLFSSGVWSSNFVQLDPLQVDFAQTWHYDTDSFLWENVNNIIDTEDIVPLFPPTPFAYYKEVIEAFVNQVQEEGLFIGSSNGAGSGALSVAVDGICFSGALGLNEITTLTITDTVTLSGDIQFIVEEDSLLVIGDGSSDGDVVIKPAVGAEYAQLVIEVAAGKTFEIQLLNDLYFQGGTACNLYLSFRGAGTTVFRLPSGRILSFAPASNVSDHFGVSVQVLMDLSYDDIVAGAEQVVFEPWSYTIDDVNTRLDKTTRILFGRSSSLRFFSANEHGIDGSVNGYASLVFDVCHSGTGRTVIDIASGAESGDRCDGGINIWGSLIVGTGSEGVVTASDLRTKTYPHKRAGVGALVSITDSVAFNAVVHNPDAPSDEDAAAWVARGVACRRGLVVLNHNKTYPYLAANLEQASSLQLSSWAIAQKTGTGYQPGFVVADNGQLRIAHNLFLDYVACSANRFIDPVVLAGADATTSTVKLRNPSAFIVDQVGQYAPSTNPALWDMNYQGSTQATIMLEGSSGCFFRAGAASDTDSCIQEFVTATSGAESLDATIGRGLYDGSFCPVLDSDGLLSLHESILVDRIGNPILYDDNGIRCLDGEHVLAIEGALTVVSVMGRFGFAPNGYITIPSIAIDHTGQEKSEIVV